MSILFNIRFYNAAARTSWSSAARTRANVDVYSRVSGYLDSLCNSSLHNLDTDPSAEQRQSAAAQHTKHSNGLGDPTKGPSDHQKTANCRVRLRRVTIIFFWHTGTGQRTEGNPSLIISRLKVTFVSQQSRKCCSSCHVSEWHVTCHEASLQLTQSHLSRCFASFILSFANFIASLNSSKSSNPSLSTSNSSKYFCNSVVCKWFMIQYLLFIHTTSYLASHPLVVEVELLAQVPAGHPHLLQEEHTRELHHHHPAHHSVDVGVPVHVHLVEDVAEVAVGDSVILPRLLDCPARLLDILNDVLHAVCSHHINV